MPLGVVEIREIGSGQRRAKKPFIAGTDFEVTDDSLRRSGWGALSISDVDKDLDVEYDVANNRAMNVRRYAAIPQAVRRVLEAHGCDHSGVALDKFVHRSSGQSFVRHSLQTVVDVNNEMASQPDWYQHVLKRWHDALNAAGADTFAATTIGPLTLHLARASALENAGICLHPLYGFAYLPGSGLKGMARAYAETVWLPAQQDQKQAWRQIENIFGWPPNPDRKRQINDPDHPAERRRVNDADPDSPEIKAHVGDVVFHDAWPDKWPQLVVDIVNNHHPNYYQAKPDDNNCPPGDWENPTPVYFLAVKPGTTFAFPLAKRRADVADELRDLARQWLLGALCHLGAGAKTNAGYGAFRPTDDVPPATRAAVASTWSESTKPSSHRAEFTTTLELVTPAFLAGANQQAEDCDLRPATLRGVLRWWWRTMHAGFLDVKTLRALEAAIWGDTKGGGALRIELSPIAPRGKALHSHPQEKNSGIRYLAYGMDEKSKGERKQRHWLEPAATWKLRLIARSTRFMSDRANARDSSQGQTISSAQVLEQAIAALWLLCTFGGVGSKARKGFGSLAADQIKVCELTCVEEIARALRKNCSIEGDFAIGHIESPAIFDRDLQRRDIAIQTTAVDEALDRIGQAYSAVASRFKHNVDQKGSVVSPNKAAWGLPRKIHGPRDDGPIRRNDGTLVQNADTWQGPEWLDFPKRPPNVSPANARHASPIHIHVHQDARGVYWVRILAMPAIYLTSRDESVQMLKVFVEAFESFLDTASDGPRGRTATRSPSTTTMARAAPSGKRSFGTPATVRFLGPREGKPGFRVLEQGKPEGILNQGTAPETLPDANSDIQVFIHDDATPPQYRWDKPEQKSQGTPKGGRGGRPPRGRR